MLVKSITNILYVNRNFTGNIFFGYGRNCGEVGQEPAVCHLFWAPALTKNVLSIFFSRWHLVNDSKNKRVSAFLLCFIGFETINFYAFFIKMSCFGSNLFFLKKRTTNNYKKLGHSFVQQSFLKLCTKFQGKLASRFGLGTRGTSQPMTLAYFASIIPSEFSLHSPLI